MFISFVPRYITLGTSVVVYTIVIIYSKDRQPISYIVSFRRFLGANPSRTSRSGKAWCFDSVFMPNRCVCVLYDYTAMVVCFSSTTNYNVVDIINKIITPMLWFGELWHQGIFKTKFSQCWRGWLTVDAILMA